MKINIADIKIERKDDAHKRARVDYGDIFGLADSIKRHGLIHPIVVDKCLDDECDKKWILIAGGRRLKASVFIGHSQIEATLMTDLSSVSKKEVELEENVVRQDLSWQERCELLRQLDELKRLKYGGATRSRDNVGWSLQDTADAVGMSKGAVGQDIKLARDLKDNPELVKKVSRLPKHAARKMVKQEQEAIMLKKQIDDKQLIISADLINIDCCKGIKEMANESVNLLLTDPPFAVSKIVDVAATDASSSKAALYNITESNVSTYATMRRVYSELIPELYRVMTPGAHIYVFFGHTWYCELISMLRFNGFIVDDCPLIWHKRRTSIPAKDIHYIASYEAILFGYKPPINRILTKPIPNVLDISAIPPQSRVHSLQKPLELLKIFIENSSSPGELVLDPFAGSGSTLVAAKKLQRSTIGFELDEGNYLRAQKFIGDNT